MRLVDFVGNGGRELAHRRDAVRVRQLCLGALSLAQVDDEGDALVPEFAEGRPTHKHRHAAAVFPKKILLVGFQVPVEANSAKSRSSAPAHSGGVKPVKAQAARNDIIAAISHDAEKRVVGLHDTTVKIEDAYPDDIGVDKASNLRLPFPGDRHRDGCSPVKSRPASPKAQGASRDPA